MEQFSGTDEFYAFMDLLGRMLAEAGLTESSRRLHVLIHEVAWTTGSELLGELGVELKRIQELHDPRLPAELSEAVSRSLRFVRKYWPDL